MLVSFHLCMTQGNLFCFRIYILLLLLLFTDISMNLKDRNESVSLIEMHFIWVVTVATSMLWFSDVVSCLHLGVVLFLLEPFFFWLAHVDSPAFQMRLLSEYFSFCVLVLLHCHFFLTLFSSHPVHKGTNFQGCFLRQSWEWNQLTRRNRISGFITGISRS